MKMRAIDLPEIPEFPEILNSLEVAYETLKYLSTFPVVDLGSGLEMKQLAAAALQEMKEPRQRAERGPITAPDVLRAAESHIRERANTYDSQGGERSMSATVEAFNSITGHKLCETQGWLFMLLLKAVRANQKQSYHADSFEDMAAYAGLAAEAKAKETL